MESESTPGGLPLRHYYHVFADGVDCEAIAREHCRVLKSSGLLDRLDHLHVGFVGSRARVASVRFIMLKELGRAFSYRDAVDGWEQETLDVLFDDAVESKEPFLAFYAHTKGATGNTEMHQLWRRMMTRYNLVRWQEAVSHFAAVNLGAAGCMWRPLDNGRLANAPPTEYFGGNFWWARSEALAKIGRPARLSRYCAEVWIGRIIHLPEPYDTHCFLDVALEAEALRPHAE